MSRNLVREWEDGFFDEDEETFEKFTHRDSNKGVDNRESNNDISRVRKERERARWAELEDED